MLIDNNIMKIVVFLSFYIYKINSSKYPKKGAVSLETVWDSSLIDNLCTRILLVYIWFIHTPLWKILTKHSKLISENFSLNTAISCNTFCMKHQGSSMPSYTLQRVVLIRFLWFSLLRTVLFFKLEHELLMIFLLNHQNDFMAGRSFFLQKVSWQPLVHSSKSYFSSSARSSAISFTPSLFFTLVFILWYHGPMLVFWSRSLKASYPSIALKTPYMF